MTVPRPVAAGAWLLVVLCMPTQALAHTAEKHLELGTGDNPWLDNLGPTGARAVLRSKNFLVKEVREGSPAARAGLRIEDLIVGVNGKEFSEFYFDKNKAPSPDFHGYEGPRMDLGNAIEDSEGRDGRLVFTVKRGGQTLDIAIQIEVLGRFSDTWPFQCNKSRKLLEKVTEAAENWPKRAMHRFLEKSMLGFSMLALGQTDRAREVAHTLAGSPFKDHQYQWSWHMGYGLIFLTEYYAITNDEAVIPNMKRIIDGLIWQQCRKYRPGGWGHYGVNQVVGGYRAMAFPTHLALTGLSNAWQIEQLRTDELERTIELGFDASATGTFTNGAIAYGIKYVDRTKGAGYGKPGASAVMFAARRAGLQAGVADYERDVTFEVRGGKDGSATIRRKKHMHYLALAPDYLKTPRVIRQFTDMHGDESLGVFWAVVGAMLANNEQTLRANLDYMKPWFNCARTENGMIQTQIGRDWSSFGYHKTGPYTHCTAAWILLLTYPDAKLKLQGADLHIRGVKKSALEGGLASAFALLEKKQLNKAEKLIRPVVGDFDYRAIDHKSSKDTQQHYAALMMKHLMGKVEPRLASLKELASAGDVCRLRDTLSDLQPDLGGIPGFETLKVGWKAKLAEEPWSTDLVAGDALKAVLKKRATSSTVAQYLKKLDDYLTKYSDSFYAGPTRAERESVMAGVERTIAGLEATRVSGDIYSFSSRLKAEASRLTGVEVFTIRNREWQKFLRTAEAQAAIRAGRAYFDAMSRAAKLKASVLRGVEMWIKQNRKLADKKDEIVTAHLRKGLKTHARRLQSVVKQYPESVYATAARAALSEYEKSGETVLQDGTFGQTPAK